MMKKVDIYSPQLVILRERVEGLYGRQVRTPYDFAQLSEKIMATSAQYLSVSTLERTWGYVKSYSCVSSHTLDVLSRYAGFCDFKSFCESLDDQSMAESEIFDGDSISTSSLNVGQKIFIAWQPNREVTLEYLGDRKFVALQSCNSKLKAGDTFICDSLQLHWPLFVNNLTSGGAVYPQYVMGKNNGLTALKLIK